MELTVENIRRIKKINDEQGGGITWNDLVELFGKEIYFWEYVLKEPEPEESIKIELNSFNLMQAEKTLIIEALKLNNYNQIQAARACGITPRMINYKIINYNIVHDKWMKNKPK